MCVCACVVLSPDVRREKRTSGHYRQVFMDVAGANQMAELVAMTSRLTISGNELYM